MRRPVLAAPAHRGAAALLQSGMGVLAPLISLARRLSGHLPFDPRITNLETHLLTCGLSQPPLEDLSALAQSARSRDTRTSAAIVLARWHMRPQRGADPASALDWVRAAQGTVRAPAQRRYLIILELLCLHALGDRDQAQQVLRRALGAGHDSPDLMLAAANLETEDTGRIGWINRALAAYGIPPIGLNDGALPRFDRLICADRLPIRTDGPTVSVILAAHAAEATLPTALRALQDQTWQNLEILVVDDASPTDGTAQITRQFAAQDPRIRLIEMAENGGAYMARNRALELATGEYVTLQDADDWSHPRRIEAQVDFLRGAKAVLACTSEQARATDDLGFERWIGAGRAIVTNYASLMVRRAAMRAHFGYWDTVRLSADNELIRRMRAAFGARAVRFLPTGPLAFQRYAPRSMTSDPVLGMSGVLYGARQEYFEAQMHAHRAGPDLRYGNDPAIRPFPAPGLMRPDRARIAAQENAFDVIVATDFRSENAAAQDALEDIGAARAKGLRVAAFALYRYSGVSRRIQPVAMVPEIRQRLWDLDIRILCYGEVVRCQSLLIHDPATIAHSQRYLPRITAGSVALIARAGSSGLQAAMATAQDSFDAPVRCHPFDRAARLSLQAQGDLAAQDWDALRHTLGCSA
jgi:hypothetical protein